MKTYTISIYPHFHCLGGACPHSCCKGWQIAVDDETYARYKKMKGVYGRSLRFHTYLWKGGHYLRKQLGRCPFWNSDKRCQFQLNGETELMPMICRLYPRDSVASDVETEITLELSCIAAARLFLEHQGRLEFVESSETLPVLWQMDNHDPDFYAQLKDDRKTMLDFLWKEENDLAECWQVFYAWVYHKHDKILMERFEEAKAIKLSTDPDDMGMYYLNRKPTYAFFSLQTIDRMIMNQINYGNLRLREPRFFKLIASYKNRFSDFYVDEADGYFDEKVRKMMEKGYGKKYCSYFSYCLQQLYTKAYETYHILREYLFSVLYVQLLMVFDLVDYLDRGEEIAGLDRQSEILMLCEQGVRHNSSLTQNLLEIIRQDFL